MQWSSLWCYTSCLCAAQETHFRTGDHISYFYSWILIQVTFFPHSSFSTTPHGWLVSFWYHWIIRFAMDNRNKMDTSKVREQLSKPGPSMSNLNAVAGKWKEFLSGTRLFMRIALHDNKFPLVIWRGIIIIYGRVHNLVQHKILLNKH